MQASPAPAAAAMSPYLGLLNFRPPAALQTVLNDRFGVPMVGGNVCQPIEDGYGPVNLDYFPVRVTAQPLANGNPLGVHELLAAIRGDLGAVTDPGLARFAPYDAADGPVWSGADPLGAVLHIDMMFGGINPDDGAVVVAETSPTSWTFTTIWTPGDGYHPVSGNRRFGAFSVSGSADTYIYTMGVDRCSTVLDDLASDSVFTGARSLWRSFQHGVRDWITAHGGAAEVAREEVGLYLWESDATGQGIRNAYFSPIGAWV